MFWASKVILRAIQYKKGSQFDFNVSIITGCDAEIALLEEEAEYCGKDKMERLELRKRHVGTDKLWLELDAKPQEAQSELCKIELMENRDLVQVLGLSIKGNELSLIFTAPNEVLPTKYTSTRKFFVAGQSSMKRAAWYDDVIGFGPWELRYYSEVPLVHF